MPVFVLLLLLATQAFGLSVNYQSNTLSTDVSLSPLAALVPGPQIYRISGSLTCNDGGTGNCATAVVSATGTLLPTATLQTDGVLINFVPSPDCTLTSPTTWSCNFIGLSSTQAFSVLFQVDSSQMTEDSAIIQTATFTVNSVMDLDTFAFDIEARSDIQLLNVMASTTGRSDSEIVAGETVSLTAVIQNNGPSDARAVVLSFDAITDSFTLDSSSHTCSMVNTDLVCELGDLVASANTMLSATFVSPATIVAGATDSLNLRAASSDVETTALNNNIQLAFQFARSNDLFPQISAPSSVVAGESFMKTIAVTNMGPSLAENAHVLIAFGSLTDLTILPPNDCTFSNSIYDCTIASLSPTNTIDFLFEATVSADALSDLSCIATSSPEASSFVFDPITSNDEASQTISLAFESDLEIISVSPSSNPATAGTEVDFVIIIRNNGPSSVQSGSAFLDFVADTNNGAVSASKIDVSIYCAAILICIHHLTTYIFHNSFLWGYTPLRRFLTRGFGNDDFYNYIFDIF